MLEEKDTTLQAKHCQYFVKRKKRYCRMTIKRFDTFCGEHQQVSLLPGEDDETNSNSKIRIPCPLDNKHTCYAHKLQKHLKICNARKDSVEPYIVYGINSRNGVAASSTKVKESAKPLSSYPADEVKKLIDKINKIYEGLNIVITPLISKHPIVETEMEKPEYGIKTKKHLIQASAIVGILNEYNMLNVENQCFIEFGAGRGQLSYWLSKTTSDQSTILLIEKMSPKHKKDNKLDKTAERIQRVRADIGDLVLDKLDIINKSDGIVGVSKHLCGGATDLAISCMMNVSENKMKVNGCMMTFCCHHRCLWTCYTGQSFLNAVGLTENDFEIMCGMVSWATCGSGFSRERRNYLQINNEEKGSEERNELGISREHKEMVGQRCKNLINWGRLLFLESLGYKCNLHYYVDSDITPENVCIVAYKQ